MDPEPSKEAASNAIDEDDCSGEDESIADVRRSRFCNERQALLRDETPQVAKRMKLNDGRLGATSRYVRQTPLNQRRKPYPKFRPQNRPHQHIQSTIDVRHKTKKPTLSDNRSSVSRTYRPRLDTVQDLPPTIAHESVIHINPKFIKKFIEKSIELSSAASKNTLNIDTAPATSRNSVSAVQQQGCNNEDDSLEESCLGPCPKGSLQAAATMAIIRLVTECIEDDSRRDEKLNKVLANRLRQLVTKDKLVTQKTDRFCESRTENKEICDHDKPDACCEETT